MPKARNKRVLIEVTGGCVYFHCDTGVDVEVIDWDTIKDGTIGSPWTVDQVQTLRDTFRGLVEGQTIDRLMTHAEATNAND
jgi:hypothetical protein